MRRLCADLVRRLAPLAHIDLRAVAISFSQTRRPVSHGLQATLTPLRFESGSLFMRHQGTAYTIERLYDPGGWEYLYLLSFYLPRFLDQPFEEKLTTILHELWHISPRFDGDLRRLGGRCHIHGPSQDRFDAFAGQLARMWLASEPHPQLHAFLAPNFRQLVRRHGSVFGTRIRSPRLIPLPQAFP